MALGETGLPSNKTVSNYIDTLWSRRHHLLDRIFDREQQKLPAHYERAEVAALEYALAVMEADRANLRRLRENVMRVEHRLRTAEQRPDRIDRSVTPEWDPPKPWAVKY